MRALRKIIFINSAHIRYAEVKLDGNVHFIGTQGVGKSTLLRAILFFYNADKLHLGIPKEMKSFDEFYLPHANSYIIYEVEHEHGPFCILTFRSSGRACFRFIDAEFCKDWLINDFGEVTAESKVIRERIGGAYMSKIIDRYEQYRDILYGNRQAVDKEFSRFRLMESNRYQNIPRSIQNVFLNSRLDANFIKDIIIHSMSEEEAFIDLGYFRRQVSDFEQEYNDISCWYKLNKKGESVVRKQAENVVKAYHELLYLQQQIEELSGELNYAVRTSSECLPLIEKKISELELSLSQKKRLLGDLQQKFETEKSSLNQELGGVNANLKRLKERRDYYIQAHIDDIMLRCSKEQIVKSELETQKSRLTDLTTHFNDVTAKYKSLYMSLEIQLEHYRQTQENAILQLRGEKQKKEEQLREEYDDRNTAIEKIYKDKIELSQNLIAQLKEEQNAVEKELLKLRYWHPCSKEMEALQKDLDALTSRDRELNGLISTTDAGIKQLQAEYDKLETSILSENKLLQEKKQKEIEETQRRIDEIEKLLNRTKGSLYEWLEENKRDWEQNIGRIVNEEHVLYQTGLHPQMTDGASLFGVKLDLTDLPLSVRKPTQLKEEKLALEAKLSALKSEFRALIDVQEKQVAELKQKLAPKMKDLRQKKSMYEVERQVIPQKQKTIKVNLEDLAEKERKAIEERKNELNSRQQDIEKRRSMAERSLEELHSEEKKQKEFANKKFRKEKEEALKFYEQKSAEIRADVKMQEKCTENKLNELHNKELEELKGRGADTQMVTECHAAIKRAEDELKYIDNHRRLTYDYQRDKEELFNHEGELKGHKKQITEKLQQLSDKYADRKRKHDEALLSLNQEITERKQEKNHIDEELAKAERFVHNENLCPPTLAEAGERQTLRTPGQAVDKLTEIIVSRQARQNQFKACVNVFKSNFSAKNTFNFRIELSTDEDYLDFANNLDDFLINNKIEEYRRRTSERYVDILARISKEMGELTRHESDVDKIIHEINNDFKERNFAGVIKLIALQSVPSSDKMVQLMKRIKTFNDENLFAMGELNLFSSANRDEINDKAVGLLLDFMKSLLVDPQRQMLTLSHLFQLQFRIVENDNDTGWADKISHVGSEGTDTLVKAMINIMLINVFKEKVSKRFGDFRIHCMMDEIGKLHPQNVKGILDFANARNILLINSSPTTYNVSDYRYTYLLSKDGKSQTMVHPLISQK